MKQKRDELAQRTNTQLVTRIISVFLIAMIFAVLVASLNTPTDRFTGRWSGTLFQAPGGGITSSYTYTMTIVERDGHLEGASTIRDGSYDGTLLFDATISGDTLNFHDTKILTSDLPDSYWWCIKTGTLNLSSDGSTLSGSWTGDNGCAPGTISLQRNPD